METVLYSLIFLAIFQVKLVTLGGNIAIDDDDAWLCFAHLSGGVQNLHADRLIVYVSLMAVGGLCQRDIKLC